MKKHYTFHFDKDEFRFLEVYLLPGTKTTVTIINCNGDITGTFESVERIDYTPGLGEIHVEGMENPGCIFEDEQRGMTLTQTTEYNSKGDYTITTQTLDIRVYWK